MTRNDHPLRQWTVDEMHLRRFAPVPDHCEIIQAVRLIDADQRLAEDSRLINQKPPFDEANLGPRHASGHTKSGIHFLWERHTEASTITLIFPHEAPQNVRAPYLQWLEQWPGSVVRATRIFVVPDGQQVDKQLSRLEMAEQEIVCCDINADLRIWSDFGIHSDGYGRLLVTAGSVNGGERGRIIQRVQELGNYRNLALLGFPTVQKYGPEVDELEKNLSDHAEQVARATEEDDDTELLQQLAKISAKLELIRSASGFRLSATTAYAEVALDRLRSLNVKPVANHQSLTDFTERRLIPASRTCSVFQDRLARIAERIARVMHTLDVRVDLRIKAQNLSLTQSMERSTLLQLRLQTLVEGLSIIAAAYYLVGLIGYVIKGVAAFPDGAQSDLAIGAITIPIIFLIWAMVHRLRKKVLKEADAKINAPPND